MNAPEFYHALVREIIAEQEMVIGPLAWEQAGKVPGLLVEKNKFSLSSEEPKKVVEELVLQYAKLFGQASVEICRSAAGRIMRDYGEGKEVLPQNLQV